MTPFFTATDIKKRRPARLLAPGEHFMKQFCSYLMGMGSLVAMHIGLVWSIPAPLSGCDNWKRIAAS
jgi:hypothetical protein